MLKSASFPSVIGGNLVVATSGNGIDFSATAHAAGMTSEVFSDYEEGTWTPVLTCATPGDLNVVYSTQLGIYTKVGRLVTVYASVITSTFTHSTASGAIRFTGLPFTVGQRGVGSIAFERITKANYTNFTAVANPTSTYAEVFASASAQVTSTVKITEMPTAGTVAIQFTLTYSV